MAWTLNPAIHCADHCIGVAFIVGNVFTEGRCVERFDHHVTRFEAIVAERNLAVGHIFRVGHRNIV